MFEMLKMCAAKIDDFNNKARKLSLNLSQRLPYNLWINTSVGKEQDTNTRSKSS